MNRLAATRVILAAICTVGLLPWAWGNVIVRPLVHDVEWRWFGILAGGIALNALFSWNLAAALAQVRWVKWLRLCLPIGWVCSLGIVSYMNAVRTPSAPAQIGLFVLSSLWLLWIGWIGYRGRPAAWRWVVLGALLVGIIPFPILVKVDGLTGDNKIKFAWRLAKPHEGPVPVPPGTSAPSISLGPSSPDDSPQFFGPARSGIYPNVKLANWDEQAPRELWRQPIGKGWSSFSVVGNYCFTQEQRGPDECVTCYRVTDGEPTWVHIETTRFNSSMGGDGPRATPTISGGRVYAVGATGRLVCLDAATGKKLWGADLLADFGLNEKQNLEHGVCCSPLIDGDRVIVCPPGENGPCLAAYHRESGVKLWAAGTRQASYSSPTLCEIDGVRQILLFNRDGLSGHDANAGKELWHFPWSNGYRVNCAQPIPDAAGPGTILLSTGYGTGATKLTIKRDGPDNWSATSDWKRNVLKTKFTSAVVFENHVYGLDDGILTCVEVSNGKPAWKDGRYKHGQVILAGDRLIVQDEAGDVVMVEPTPTRWKELGRVRGLRGENGEENKSWNIPVLTGRYLLVRNDVEAVCYELGFR